MDLDGRTAARRSARDARHWGGTALRQSNGIRDALTAGDPLEADTTGNKGLTNQNGIFKFNWDTPYTPGCYQLQIASADGNTITSNYNPG